MHTPVFVWTGRGAAEREKQPEMKHSTCETPLFPNRPDRSASLRLPKLSISGTYDLKSVLS